MNSASKATRAALMASMAIGFAAAQPVPYGAATPSPRPPTSVRVATPPLAPASAAVTVRPRPAAAATAPLGVAITAASLRYERLPAAAMGDVSRRIDEHVKAVLNRPDVVAKNFAGAVVATSAEAGAPPLKVVPLVFVDDPLRFNAASGRYEGRVAVGLIEMVASGVRRSLGASINFQLLGDVQSAPDMAAVTDTAPPFAFIKVSASDPGDSVRVRVMTNLAADPVPLELPVERSRLELAGKTRLQGWGLETTDVTVSASDGAVSRGAKVSLTLDRGTIAPAQAVLDDAGTAVLTLRSDGTGGASLSARSARHREVQRAYQYDMPLRSMSASLLGGLGGGALRQFGARRTGMRRRIAEMLGAVLCGALVWGLFVLGVNVLGIALPSHGGEVLVAVVSALGAYIGVRLLPGGKSAG
jgi:hypothetical protein